MTRGIGPVLLVFLVVIGLSFLFTRAEGFAGYTLTGNTNNRKTGEACRWNAECASDICRHFDSAEGPQHTCQ
jgi:hypothetical protein